VAFLTATVIAAAFLSSHDQFVLALGVNFAIRTLVRAAALANRRCNLHGGLVSREISHSKIPVDSTSRGAPNFFADGLEERDVRASDVTQSDGGNKR